MIATMRDKEMMMTHTKRKDDEMNDETKELRAAIMRLGAEKDKWATEACERGLQRDSAQADVALLQGQLAEHSRLLKRAHRTLRKLGEQLRETRDDLRHMTELRQHGCECSDDEACAFARARDSAQAEVKRLQRERDGLRVEVERLRDGYMMLPEDLEVQRLRAERDTEREQHALWRGRHESTKEEVERLRSALDMVACSSAEVVEAVQAIADLSPNAWSHLRDKLLCLSGCEACKAANELLMHARAHGALHGPTVRSIDEVRAEAVAAERKRSHESA